jgi:hypothetical protein
MSTSGTWALVRPVKDRAAAKVAASKRCMSLSHLSVD